MIPVRICPIISGCFKSLMISEIEAPIAMMIDISVKKELCMTPVYSICFV